MSTVSKCYSAQMRAITKVYGTVCYLLGECDPANKSRLQELLNERLNPPLQNCARPA